MAAFSLSNLYLDLSYHKDEKHVRIRRLFRRPRLRLEVFFTIINPSYCFAESACPKREDLRKLWVLLLMV